MSLKLAKVIGRGGPGTSRNIDCFFRMPPESKKGLTNEISHVGIVVLAGDVVQQAQLAEVQLLQAKDTPCMSERQTILSWNPRYVDGTQLPSQ